MRKRYNANPTHFWTYKCPLKGKIAESMYTKYFWNCYNFNNFDFEHFKIDFFLFYKPFKHQNNIYYF